MTKKNSKDLIVLKSKELSIVPNKDLSVIKDKSLVIIPSKELLDQDIDKASPDALKLYISQIAHHKLLTREQEKELTQELFETGDIDVAKKLVLANLRLVVKIAMEYRSTYQNVMDLIQEGNIGLMKAVSKYDPTKGAKLSYYASWWIKSYILKYILDNFRLVKIGTTNEQKKLFYNLMKEKERLQNLGEEGGTKQLAQNLGVSEKSVTLMEQRLNHEGGEISIDKPVNEQISSGTIADLLTDQDSISIDDELSNLQNIGILKENLVGFLASLKDRDQEIFKKRLLNEVPLSLQAIANDYGVSRERVRQIEERLLNNLRVYMKSHLE